MGSPNHENERTATRAVTSAGAVGSVTHHPSDDAASGDLGNLLRQALEQRGLTLDEIARRTKIPKRHLESLERNNLAALPPGMYRRAEVLAYAAAVNLDPQQALASLARAQNAASPPA